MAEGVLVWWAALSVLTVFNLAVWTWSSRSYFKQKALAPKQYSKRWPHLVLSAAYVLGCGFRSILPRADVQRIVLYDSWLSSVFVGRSVATIAELCFVAQWALMLHELSQAENNRLGLWLSRAIVPLITIAELFSWYAVLSTNFLGNAIEQSIWTFTAAMLTVALYFQARRATGTLRLFLSVLMVVGAGFVAFMCTVDVPMYVTRWRADELAGRPYLSLAEGLRDVSSRWVVTHSWSDWHEEIAWMSLYFSIAVWMSIAFIHAPRALAADKKRISLVPAE